MMAPIVSKEQGAALAALKRHHMVHLGADADPLPQFVVMVAGHMGQHRLPSGKAQGVEKLRAAKRLADDFGFHRRIVIVHDVVGAQQNIALA